MTNHYLCLVKASKGVNIRHSIKYPVIADSGANFHYVSGSGIFCQNDSCYR
jgi:hypothetical protein